MYTHTELAVGFNAIAHETIEIDICHANSPQREVLQRDRFGEKLCQQGH